MLKFWIVVLFWAHQFTGAVRVEGLTLAKFLSVGNQVTVVTAAVALA
jgi:hypothetical protein